MANVTVSDAAARHRASGDVVGSRADGAIRR